MAALIKFFENIYCKLCLHPKVLNYTILLATAGIFTLFSFLTPYVYDDIAYHYCCLPGKAFFDIHPGITPLINSWGDIFSSVKSAYFSWSGRAISMFTVYAVFFCGKAIFNVLNGAVAAAVIYMIGRHICGRRALTPSLLLTVAGIFFLCAPSPGLTLFWSNGAIIYMWTSLFYLILLYPYRIFLEYGSDEKISFPGKLFLIPAGIIGSSANENFAVTAIIFLIIFLIFTAWKYRKIPLWMFLGLAGTLIGGIILLFAPGASGRIASEGYHEIPVFSNLFTQTAHIFHTIPGLGAAIVMVLLFKGRKFSCDQWQLIIFYLLLILGSGYSMIFSPYTPGRAVFCTFIFMICCAGTIFRQLDFRKYSREIIAGTVLCSALMSAAFALRDIAFTNRICKARFAAMQAARQENKSLQWIFRPTCGISSYNALYKTDIMREDPEHFLNKHYAKKYGQTSITLSPMPAVQGMEQNIFPGDK